MFGPNLKGSVEKGLKEAGVKVFKTIDDLKGYIDKLNPAPNIAVPNIGSVVGGSIPNQNNKQ